MSNPLDAIPVRQRKPLRISTDIPLFVRCSSNPSSSSSSSTTQNTTPGITPSTGAPQYFSHVLCMHDFESSDPVQLSFLKGEVLTVVKQEHSGWWAAMRPQGDRIGWIPSSFVQPVDGNKIAEGTDEALAPSPYESLNNPPLSAVHDHWVPVYEDHAALSFRLVSPTEPVLYKGFFDDRLRNHDREPPFSLPNDERPSDRRPYPPSPLSSGPGTLHLNRPTNLSLRDAALHLHQSPCRIDDEASFLCSMTSDSSDEIASQLISGLHIEDLQLVSASQDRNYLDPGIDGQSQCSRLSRDSRSAVPVQSTPKTKLLDLTIWGPDNLAEQLCVLMHTLYAVIRQNDCFDWIMGRRNTDMTGLRSFFDIHDHITSWVQKSILAHDDMARQTEALDFWISVAEKCHAFRNFDSVCGIILALSGSSLSLLGSAWARCARERAFVALRNVLDVTNKFDGLMDIMDAATGPSVPFVCGYLVHIKMHHVEHSNKPSHPSTHAADAGSSATLWRMQLAAVSALLRHQSSPYGFKITKSLRSFIDDELQAVRLANDQSLARSC